MNTFTVCTVNLFVGAVKHKPEKVLADIGRYLSNADFLVVEEAGEAEKILHKAAQKYDVFIYDGFGLKGQGATAIISKRAPRKSKSFPLTQATHVGQSGAGPSVLKPKWYQTSLFRIYGRAVWIGVLHTAPSIYIHIREMLALEATQDAAKATTTIRGLKVIGGDYNSEPDHRVRNPLEREGLVSSQNELGWINTMENRCIDDQHYSKKWKKGAKVGNKIRAVKHWTMEGSTDHRAYFVEYEVNPTIRWKLRKKLTGRSD